MTTRIFAPKALALALAAVPLGAAAQSSIVLYGTFVPNVDVLETRGATTSVPSERPNQVAAGAYTGTNAARQVRMTSSISNFGIRGTESLGGGISAWFQVENSVGVDGGPPSAIAGRNTAVGLSGTWGSAFMGQWDTPYKFPNILLGTLRASFQWEASNLVNTPGFNVPVTTTQAGRANAKPDAAFNRRQGNILQYWTPTWNGFSGRLAYGIAEGKQAATTTQPAITPDLWSGLVTYQNGGLRVDYAHERHNDYFGLAQAGGSPGATLTNTSSSDYGNQLSINYRWENWRFIGTYERLVYSTDDSAAGAVRRFEKDGWWVAVEPRFGAHQVWAAYGQADKGKCELVGSAACSTAGLGASQYSVGYSYTFSKRTDFYTAYYVIKNAASAQYTTLPAAGGGSAPGADTYGIDIGLLHSF